jgi:hypothetical protein
VIADPNHVRGQRALAGLALAACAVLACTWSRDFGPGSSAGIAPATSRSASPERVRGRLVDAAVATDVPRLPDTVPPASRQAAVRAPEPRTSSAQPADTCALAGRISRRGEGVRARVRVEAERGSHLEVATDQTGAFRLDGIAPGRRPVIVELEDGRSCSRALSLRPHRESRLELDFDRPLPVSGRVRDPDGEPIAGAHVLLDGQRGSTDLGGRFTLEIEASGTPELLVQAPGWAWFTCAVRDAREPLEIELEPACSVEVRLTEPLRGQEVVVHVAPAADQGSSTPWHLLSPVHSSAQDVVTFENLPPGEIEAWVLGAGAVARAGHVTLIAGRRERVEPREEASGSARGSPWIAALWRSQALAARPVAQSPRKNRSHGL